MIKTTFRRLVYLLAQRVSVVVENARRDHLLRSLKARGQNLSFYMPVRIDGADNVEMGNNVAISPFVHIWGGGGVKIGDGVMIGSHSAITSETHDYTSEVMCKTHLQKKVVIEDNVWIGTHSVIMPGVTIGKGAVIGAGSVVTKDVAPKAIMVGVPARLLKNRGSSGPSETR
jgi:acetyltransferase-like isoleucine patch superfamily enzyme